MGHKTFTATLTDSKLRCQVSQPLLVTSPCWNGPCQNYAPAVCRPFYRIAKIPSNFSLPSPSPIQRGVEWAFDSREQNIIPCSHLPPLVARNLSKMSNLTFLCSYDILFQICPLISYIPSDIFHSPAMHRDILLLEYDKCFLSIPKNI
jgi:hypothetical protein